MASGTKKKKTPPSDPVADWLAKAPTITVPRRPKDRGRILRALAGFEDRLDPAGGAVEVDFSAAADLLERVDDLLEQLGGDAYVDWIMAVPGDLQELAMLGLFNQIAPTLGKGSK